MPDPDATSELLTRLAHRVGLERAPILDEPAGPIDLTRAESLVAIGEPALHHELDRSAADPGLSSAQALRALLRGRRTDEPIALATSGENLVAELLAVHPGRVVAVGDALAFLRPSASLERRSEAEAEAALAGARLVVVEPGLPATAQLERLVRAARGAGCAVALDATRTAFRVGPTLDAGGEDLDADYVLFGPALAAGLPLFAARGLAAPDLEPDPFAVAVACAVVRTLRDRPLHAELVRALAVLRSTAEREAAAQEIRVRVDGVAGLPRLVFLGQEDAPGELIAEHFARELELAGVRMRGPLLLPPSLRLDAEALDAACRAFAHAFVRIRALLVEYNSHLSGGLPWPFRTGQETLRTRGLTFYRYPRRAEVDVGSNGEAMRIAFGRSQLGPVTSSGFYVPTRLVGDLTLTIRYALRQWNAGPDSACLGLFFQNEASTARYYAQVISTCDAPTQRSVAAGLAGNVVGRRPIDGDEGWLRLCRSGDVLVATWRAGADLPWVELGRCEATPDPLIAGCKIWSKVATEGLVADLFDLQIDGELAADQPELLPAREDPRHG